MTTAMGLRGSALHVVGAYAVAVAALLHGCWSNGEREKQGNAAQAAAAGAMELAEKGLETATTAAGAARQAVGRADEAMRQAKSSDVVHDGDRVKLRDCEEWAGDRRCKLVK